MLQQLRTPNLTAQGNAAEKLGEWLREHGLDLADLSESLYETRTPLLLLLQPLRRAG